MDSVFLSFTALMTMKFMRKDIQQQQEHVGSFSRLKKTNHVFPCCFYT